MLITHNINLTNARIFKIKTFSIFLAPIHELISLNSQNYGRSLAKRRILSVSAFGELYNLNLELRDDVLIGKNTPVWLAESNPWNPIDIKYSLLPNVSFRILI